MFNMFFAGFISCLILCFVFIPLVITGLYGASDKMKNEFKPPEIKRKDQIVVSYSYIIPLAVLSLLFTVIVGAQITKILSTQGHGNFVYLSLSFPVFGFLIGYLYFKRVVKS